MKILRRVMVVWCVWGIVKLCVMANPLLFWVASKVRPFYDDNSWLNSKLFPNVPWDQTSVQQITFVWFVALLAAIVVCCVFATIHYSAKAIFNEK